MPGIEFLIKALTPLNLLLAVGGVVAGTVIGALPGLTATMAVAVLVPLTFGMEPASALIALGAIRITSYNVCYTKLLRMVPLAALAKVSYSSGPDSLERFNNLPAVKIFGATKPGYSRNNFV